MNNKYKLSIIAAGLLTAGCSLDVRVDDETSDEQTTIQGDKVFPTGLMVASPFADEADSSQTTSTAKRGGGTIPHYIWATKRIGRVLDGTTPLRDEFNVDSFYRTGGRAECFGPQVTFQGHPDATSSDMEDGTLPGGDLGIWLVENEFGQACVVAQTNSLLRGVQARSRMALMTLASLVSVANSEGETLPEDGEHLDLTVAMDNQGIMDVSFNDASISKNAGVWTYTVDLDYRVDGQDYAIWLQMTHEPTTDFDVYQGNLQYLVEGNETVSRIQFPGGNCQQSERTLAGSLSYDRDGDSMSMQARAATLCGHSVANTFDADGIVDPSNKYASSSNADGWSENFSIFGAEFDVSTIEGDYAYAWQAGVNDSNSRILLVGINDPDLANGEGHFGYGEQIENTDGWIEGFICNWAAPGASHGLISATQRQAFEYDESSRVYMGTDHRANIEYAPTSSCEYDGLTNFVFDIDASGTLGDIIAEDASLSFTSDLWSPTDTTHTLPQGLQARGINVPTIPYGWPAP
ncbi:hypothetical protein DS2_10202 [Catenovulum agarivorans DS-2]|uniref:Lipoprotein n=1 Tax=Catenovulum agarivorans DS-2 TaxID=1328313 RepID=W7QDJ8_9ALTE|nr:hypothetical protein [Catenovulum agarivorans]EWH09991.1 hypothetical protein DS2_10202 [Catenovulum agarivorans DS-2]